MSKDICENSFYKDNFETQNEENFGSGDEDKTGDIDTDDKTSEHYKIKKDLDASDDEVHENEDEVHENNGDLEIDEPVSPPPCDPEDAPQILISQNIEDLATEVVVESRKQMMKPQKIIQMPKVYSEICSNKTNPSLSDIPKTVLRPTINVSGPSLIPLTVSEMETDEETSAAGSSSLHMSGGGVYTTDSFYYLSSVKEKQRCSVITKVPERKECNNDENNPEQNIDDLVDFFSNNSSEKSSSRESVVCRFPQPTIKISDSLEITPITIKPIPFSKVGIMKRKLDKTACSVPEKRKCLNQEIPSYSDKKNSESDTITPGKNDIILDCKLVISNNDNKKVKLVFENGVSVQLSKQVLKNSNLENHQTNKIRRKQLKKNPKSSEKTHERSTKQKPNIPTGNPVVQMHKEAVVEKSSHKMTDTNEFNEDKEVMNTGSGNSNNFYKIPKQITNNSKIPGLHKLPSMISKPTFYASLKRTKLTCNEKEL